MWLKLSKWQQKHWQFMSNQMYTCEIHSNHIIENHHRKLFTYCNIESECANDLFRAYLRQPNAYYTFMRNMENVVMDICQWFITTNALSLSIFHIHRLNDKNSSVWTELNFWLLVFVSKKKLFDIFARSLTMRCSMHPHPLFFYFKGLGCSLSII